MNTNISLHRQHGRLGMRAGLFLLVLALTTPAWSQAPAPASVIRWEAGWRHPQAGWIVLHIEGNPYERGEQHGRLLAPEIAAYLRCFALTLNSKAPAENWKHTRTLVNTLFLRKFDQEYLEEMKGIADGASAAGARFDGRALDVVDIAALNCWCEIDALPEANTATPTGLEGFKKTAPPAVRAASHFERCSAFVAVGPATADGKIVFGHVTMFDLYPSTFCNVWIDVQPVKGRRFVMCSFPGGIQSSMDYYINDAGLLISETSLAQTTFNPQGMTCASRIRKAIQYAGTIDAAVQHLIQDNNGLYTNEWLLADINTNEIAMLALGTRKHKLWRSSRNEWFGGTAGFYWSCNSCKDTDIRLETIASTKGRPAKAVFCPSDRDLAWVKLYEKHRGKIGVPFVQDFCASDVLSPPTALDAKFTTSALARQLQSWASFGPPTGKPRQPTEEEKKKYPEIRALVKSDWTLLGTTPPVRSPANKTAPTVTNPAGNAASAEDAETELVWRGTLLPQTDGDLWLALAFADYHDLVAQEKQRLKSGVQPAEAAAKLKEGLQECRKQHEAAAKSGAVALADVKQSVTSDDWHRLASAKGVLLLHELRAGMGADAFDKAMDDFGMRHGGQRVTSRQFQQHLESITGWNLGPFFAYWLREKGLPTPRP